MTVATAADPGLATLLAALDAAKVGVHGFRFRGGTLERLFVNRSAASRLGYTLEQLTAVPWLDNVAPHERSRLVELLGRVAQGEAPAAALELDMVHRDGRVVASEISTTQLDVDGDHILVSLVRDAGSQVPRSMLETDRLAVVGALASGIAHEINNPLTSVLLHLRSLRRSIDRWDPDSRAEAAPRVDEAFAGAERIRAIVRAVMTFAASPGTPIDVDLGAVVQSALTLARPELESRGRVVCQLIPVEPVRADEPRIGQAVLSMLLFASAGFRGDAAAENRIAIGCEMRGGQVVLEIADNGDDLSADELARVHDAAFVRTSGDGAAYGLGIARSIAMGAGGRLVIGKRPGGGVVVTLSLPAAPPTERADDRQVGGSIATGPEQG